LTGIAARSERSSIATTIEMERIHILVVDDLPDVAESTAELLTL